MMARILVVCIGNICRSPMAEALLGAALPDHQVSSAGLFAMEGYPADAHALELLAERGIDISSHRARALTQELCDQSDVILVMDCQQKQELASRHPTTRGKLYRLGDPEGFDVFDPYRLDRIEFERCLALIEKGVEVWRNRMKAIL